ncbi:MAG: FHA domain-containing protein [Desulfovibrio sp.]|nr:FHA domain-containing protein [Desulfovibrio sp.]MBI4958455.1 FHA domain-containing protein [Desulfovibrio sp.]
MLILTVSRAGEHFTELKASGDAPVTLGSSNANTLPLPDDALAREHCVLSMAGAQWVLTDLAGGGVFVNSSPVTQRTMEDGDIIGLGPFKLVVSIKPDETQARPLSQDPVQSSGQAAVPAQKGESIPAAQPDSDTGPAQDKTVFRPRPTFEGQGANALEVFEGPRQGLIHRFGDTLHIGRASDCDLVLDDPSISRQHGLVSRSKKGWEAKSLHDRNPLTLNGQAIRTAPVKTGDILGVGPARLRLVLSAEAAAPKRRFEIPPVLQNRKVLLGIGAGVFLVLVLGLFLSGPEKKPGDSVLQEARQKERAMDEAEISRKVSTLMVQGQKLVDQGEWDQAVARFQAVLDIQPGNAEATRSVADLRGKIAEREAKARERERQTAELHKKVVGMIVEGDRLLSQGKFDEAAAAVGKALKVSPDDKEAQDLLAKITQASEASRRAAEEKSRKQAESRARLRDVYAKADEYARIGQLYQAMKLYREASAEDTDQARAADAKAKAARLQDTLVKQVMPDYNQGLKYYSQKKYHEALKCWLNVLAVYPEAKETNAKVAELRPTMEAEAKRLYEEGLVYEGLGNRQEAMKRWEAVLEIMPFEDNPYRLKALAKRGN